MFAQRKNMLNREKLSASYCSLGKNMRVAFFIATLLRILLQMGIPVWYIEASPHDDMLLINYANSILEGKWLGEYCDTTLNKNPFFSIFLASINKLNISYMLGVILLYTLACLIFIKAIGNLVEMQSTIYIYIYILYSPIMLDSTIQRVYRCSIIPSLVLIIVSCALKIYSERNNNIKKLIIWGILEGIAFSMFYLTREDSIWLCPFVIGAMGVTFVKLLLDNGKNISVKTYVKKLVALLIPVSLCVLSVNMLKVKNYMEYGVFTTTDFNKTGFADMGKSILQIENDEEIEHVWVTRSTIEKLYQVSPSFAVLKSELDKRYDGMDAWGTGTIDGEIETGYIIWAIRWAASATGIYDDAQEADEFFSKVNEEIQFAFQEGKLQKNNAIILSNLGRPLYFNELKEVLDSMLDNFWKNITYSIRNCSLPEPVEYTNNVNKAESITGNNILLDAGGTFTLNGWIFSENNEDTISLSIKSENEIVKDICFEDSLDVYEKYIDFGDFENAKKCRFYVRENEDLSDYILEISLNDKMIFQEKVSEISTFQYENVKLCIDAYSYAKNTNYMLISAEKNTKIANFIIKIYQITGTMIGLTAILMYIIEFIIDIFRWKRYRRTDFTGWLIKTGFLLTILINYLAVSINYFDAENRDVAIRLYTVGTYPLWQIFVCLSLIYGAKFFKNIKRKEI